MTNDIREFCSKYRACVDGRNWALTNCTDMADAWTKLPPRWLIWVATREGVLDDKMLRLFACFCARQNWHLLTDKRSRDAVEVAERFAHGNATVDELKEAKDAAVTANAANADPDASYAAYAAANAANAAADIDADDAYAATNAAYAANSAADASYASRIGATAAAYTYADANAAADADAIDAANAAYCYTSASAAVAAEQAKWLRSLPNPFLPKDFILICAIIVV